MQGHLFKFYLYKTVSILLFIAFSAYCAYAEDSKSRKIILTDTAVNFPVLKTMLDSGFFTGNNFSAEYIPFSDINSKRTYTNFDFSLMSGLKEKEKDGAKPASFNLFSVDSFKRNVLIGWDVPREDTYRTEKSIRSMIAFAEAVRTSTIPDALAEAGTAGFPGAIEKVSVIYEDDNISNVSGYELIVNTGFSPTHRFVRTLSELTLLTGVGMANYWINKDANMEDWRYKYRWKDVGPRFRDGWYWDSNAFRTNTIYHIYAGAVYYQTARSNEYGILASTAWAFTGSLIWEYIGEWREQTSGNDMVFTAFGGALAGEAFHQTSIYIENCMPNSVYGTIFSFLLDPMRIINRALDRCFDGDYKVSIVFINPAVQAIIDNIHKDAH
ncbi:MAG: DUF3943 domain-containing protein [Spirochaetes bacterium]|nr:DUF3943 domain-containing protein [Spirochaetota bacterium]